METLVSKTGADDGVLTHCSQTFPPVKWLHSNMLVKYQAFVLLRTPEVF